MGTYGDMQARIARELHRTDLTSQIQDAIQTAILDYSNTRFWFNEAISPDINAVAGTKYYDAPADMIGLDFVSVLVNGRRYQLIRTNFQVLDQMDAGTATIQGWPIRFAERSGQIRVFPTPNQTYALTVYYTRNLPALSADADSNSWTTDAEILIRCRAKWELYEHVLLDPASSDRMRIAEADALMSLQQMTGERLSTGEVVPCEVF